MKKSGKLNPRKVASYIKQLIEALIYLRDNLVVHRDLKLANLFVSKDSGIKLGDFGLACQLAHPEQKRKSICGTPNYLAPEMLCVEGHNFGVDLWAIGVLIYAMLLGKPPFETMNLKMTYNRIQECMYMFPPDKDISLNAK